MLDSINANTLPIKYEPEDSNTLRGIEKCLKQVRQQEVLLQKNQCLDHKIEKTAGLTQFHPSSPSNPKPFAATEIITKPKSRAILQLMADLQRGEKM